MLLVLLLLVLLVLLLLLLLQLLILVLMVLIQPVNHVMLKNGIVVWWHGQTSVISKFISRDAFHFGHQRL